MDQVNPSGDPRRPDPLRPQVNQYALLPPEAPLEMPERPLSAKGAQTVHDRLTWPRAMLLLLAVASTVAFAHLLYQVLSVVHITVLQAVFLILCTLCFAWIALGTTSALLGFFAALAADDPPHYVLADGHPTHRTALLFPIYQEDAARIAATIEAIAGELVALQAARRFEVFVLSDSRAGDNKARELRAVRFLRRRLDRKMQIFYRARKHNTGKKAGNIADWVQRYGAAYDSFIILDADSIMSGDLLVRLQTTLANLPRVGLIQSVPRLVGAQTVFAKLQQFAVAYYGPIVAAGFAVWHQGSGNYWGHNAIVRTTAFAQAAGLPELSGRPPFGGHVLSHDFVEAAFLRRAGWEVRMLPYVLGSYEGCPPTLIDVAVRDRRWAQGNLQHVRIITAAQLPWVSRMHLGMGAYAYCASALWALSLVVGVVLSLQSAYTLPVYFPDTKTLFPIWPVIDPTKALYLFIGTLVVLLLPKVLGIALSVARPLRGLPRPSAIGILLGALFEMAASILIAPILMLTQTTAVLEILFAKDAGWSAQRREGEGGQLRQLARFHLWHQVLGVVLLATCTLASLYVLAWMSPIILGLLLSTALSYLTSRPAPDWVARILQTPETIDPPATVTAAERLYPGWVTLLRAG